MFKRLIPLVAVAALSLGASVTHADFPERTVENISPWSAGTAMSVSQFIAKAMGD